MIHFKHSVRFNLQLPLKSAPSTNALTVRCFVSYNGNKISIPSGIKISPQVLKAKRKSKTAIELSNSINWQPECNKYEQETGYIKRCVEVALRHFIDKNKAYPAPVDFLALYDEVFNNNGSVPTTTSRKKIRHLIQYLDSMIADSKTGRRVKTNGERFKADTTKHYDSARQVIYNFAHSVKYKERIKDFLFDEIDVEFYNQLKEYCFAVKRYSDNYFGAVIKVVKTAMGEALEEELHNNRKYQSKYFVKTKSSVDNIYLNEDQLQRLADHDFKDNYRLERARDLFLVGCWTGLRFSDFTQIRKENIERDFIYITTKKTGEPVAIPIHPNLRQVMEKYRDFYINSLPPAISNVNLNLYIKEAAKEAGLIQTVILHKAKAGRRYSVQQHLNELITTHTARRSFASNMFKLGVPPIVIMSITGHTTEAAFLNYIKLGSKEKAEILREILNRQTLKVINGDV